MLRNIREAEAFKIGYTVYLRLSGGLPNNGHVEVKRLGYIRTSAGTLVLDTQQVTEWLPETIEVQKVVVKAQY